MTRKLRLWASILIAGTLMLAGVVVPSAATPAGAHQEEFLPILFVHGASGSGAQYETQAQRFASNGYPAEMIRAYEAGAGIPLGTVVDNLLEEFDVDQVNLVGHSAGTFTINLTYLSNPANAAKVAHYVAVDGLPAICTTVDCLTITAGPLGQSHVEVATSAESFALQYEFFTGEPPVTTDVLPQPPGQVEVAGRAVNFPANSGLDGAIVEVWEINPATGARKYAAPEHVLNIGADGNFGPVPVNGQQHYEFNLIRPDSDTELHFYRQPLLRSSYLMRLNSAPPGSGSVVNTNTSDNHSAAVVVRYREWWTTHPSGNQDTLNISTSSASRPDEPPVDILTDGPITANNNIGIHVHDAQATPGETTLNLLPFFAGQAFQTGLDVFMPATDPSDGVVSVVNAPRGDTERLQVFNIPNRASSEHANIVQFNDYVQDINSWGDCKRLKPSPC